MESPGSDQSQRRPLGQHLVDPGAISIPQLEEALRLQEERRAQHKAELIGQILLRIGAIYEAQLDDALRRQQAGGRVSQT